MGSDDDCIPLMPAGSSRSPNAQLQKLIAKQSLIIGPMGLVHITVAGWAAEILRSPVPQIETRRCAVFGRDLAYFFVARAAFRPRQGDISSEDLTRFPVAFVIRPDNLGTPAHVYPFDSGAAHKGRYLNAHQSGVFLQDYALQPSMDAVRRMIAWGFGSYAGYLDAELDPMLEKSVAHSDYVARAYLRIARLAGIGANLPDGRSATIEVAYGGHVSLKSHASLVVLPQQLLEADAGAGSIRQRLGALGVDFQTYDWQPGSTPDQHMDEVQRLVNIAVRPAGPAP